MYKSNFYKPYFPHGFHDYLGGGLSSICVNLPWHGFLTLFLFDVHKNGTTELHDNDLQNSKF